MNTTGGNGSQRSIRGRLDRAGQAIDAMVAEVRIARINRPDSADRADRDGRLVRRVDWLRAREAAVRARLRELDTADRTVRLAELNHGLDELATELAVASAQLDVERADSAAVFADAVRAELAAWDAQIDRLRARVAAAAPAALTPVYEQRSRAGRTLGELRAASPAAPAALRAELRQAMADLDSAVEEAAIHINDPRRST